MSLEELKLALDSIPKKTSTGIDREKIITQSSTTVSHQGVHCSFPKENFE